MFEVAGVDKFKTIGVCAERVLSVLETAECELMVLHSRRCGNRRVRSFLLSLMLAEMCSMYGAVKVECGESL